MNDKRRTLPKVLFSIEQLDERIVPTYFVPGFPGIDIDDVPVSARISQPITGSHRINTSPAATPSSPIHAATPSSPVHAVTPSPGSTTAGSHASGTVRPATQITPVSRTVTTPVRGVSLPGNVSTTRTPPVSSGSNTLGTFGGSNQFNGSRSIGTGNNSFGGFGSFDGSSPGFSNAGLTSTPTTTLNSGIIGTPTGGNLLGRNGFNDFFGGTGIGNIFNGSGFGSGFGGTAPTNNGLGGTSPTNNGLGGTAPGNTGFGGTIFGGSQSGGNNFNGTVTGNNNFNGTVTGNNNFGGTVTGNNNFGGTLTGNRSGFGSF